MAMKVTYKRGPKAKSPAEKVKELRGLAEKYARLVRGLDLQATGTWEHQPDFPIEEIHEDGALIFNVRAQGENESIFRYVDEGTDIRYAIMTDDFVPKSQPGILSAGAGRGGFKELDFRNPAAGIEARQFGKAIVEQLKDQFEADARKILNG